MNRIRARFQGRRNEFGAGFAGRAVVAASLALWLVASAWGADGASIKFLGAARTVSGSAVLIDTGKERVLIDFGSFPHEEKKPEPLPFDPASLTHVFVTHAHADHAGRLPLLCRKGFAGSIIGTAATRDLLAITLEGTLKIDRERNAAVYGEDDIRKTLTRFSSVPYNREVSLSPHLSFRLRAAGHILGAAMVELWIRGENGSVKVVATGDMGREAFLLPPPDVIAEADYVVVESTYGPVRRDYQDYRVFGEEIRQTLLSGGSVLIPAFALDRTQKVLYVLGRLKAEGRIPASTAVYVDSPSAHAITEIYRAYGRHQVAAGQKSGFRGDSLSFSGLRRVKGQELLKAHDKGIPAIFVTSSGMLDHGQAPRHLGRMIGNERNLLAIVGFQAPGSLGAALQKGAQTVHIPSAEGRRGDKGVAHQERAVKMRVRTFDLFSNHADGCAILTWLSHLSKTKQVWVVHGEAKNALGMARAIRENLGFAASAPHIGDVYPLSASAPDHIRADLGQPCRGMLSSPASSPVENQ